MKICPFAFSKMYIGVNEYVPCCHSWLKPHYFELDHSGDPWKSSAAITLRQEMLKGNFEYCDRNKCQKPLIEIDTLEVIDTAEAFIDSMNLSKIKSGKLSELDVTAVIFAVDDRCNLACGSCRKEKITKTSRPIQSDIFAALLKFRRYLPHLRFIDFAGYSEFFFIEWTKDLIGKINKNSAPNLKGINILSNGTLLDQKMYDSLGEGKEWINCLNISIDAGDEETYQKVRGANWKQLLKNLDFISKLRRSNKIRHLVFNFTVHKYNYHSIEDFIRLGKEFNVDEVLFTGIYDWSDTMKYDYSESAVHIPTHPEYSQFLAIKNRVENESLVNWKVEVF